MDTKLVIHEYPREITKKIVNDLQHRSILLLGPRQTGKSTLLRAAFPKAHYIDLLESDTFREFSLRPELLREQFNLNDQKLTVIDEIQKIPELFDEVQSLIDRNPEARFILTGSSARKLKRGQANLLGGRLWTRHLHPLTSCEFNPSELEKVLKYGALPRVLRSPDPKRDLFEYVGTYLKEEIQAEGLTRSLPQYSRFLETVATMNAKQINFTNIGNDAQIKPRTVHDHFQVLIDTLLGFSLSPFRKTKTRKAVATDKFYLFDIGVANALQRRFEIEPRTPAYGETLEHLIFLELRAFIDYEAPGTPLEYWRSQSKFEVDFIFNETCAIEVKAKESISDQDLKGLRALKEEKLQKSFLCISLEKRRRRTEDGIEIFPLQDFLRSLWDGEITHD
jgi:predicted AAA+ superfamily ATPase